MTAREWAAGFQQGTPVRWRALELAAFDGHRKVLRQLDQGGKDSRRHRRGRERLTLRNVVLVPVVLVGMLVVLFPTVAGFATLMGDRFGRSQPDPTRAIPIAGAIFVWACLPLLFFFVMWLREGRQPEDMSEVVALVSFVWATPSAAIAWVRGSAADVPHWQLWVTPMVLASVLGAVFLLLQRRQRRVVAARARRDGLTAADHKQTQRTKEEQAKHARFARVRREVEALPAADRAAAKADLDGAVDDLAHRGVITSQEASRAHRAELGMLALRMSQRDAQLSSGGGTHPA